MFDSFRRGMKVWLCKLPTWFPNFLSLSRIVFGSMVPISYYTKGLPVAFTLFIALAATDWLDGWLARLLNAQSELGKLLDALGDWVLAGSTAVMLLFLGVIPTDRDAWQLWCLVLIFARAISIIFVVGLRWRQAAAVARPWTAQGMSAFLALSLLAFFASHEWSHGWLVQLGELLLIVSTTFAMISWGQYLFSFKNRELNSG